MWKDSVKKTGSIASTKDNVMLDGDLRSIFY